MYLHVIWTRLLICWYVYKIGRKAIQITPSWNVACRKTFFGDDNEPAAQPAVPPSHGSDQSRRGSKRKQQEESSSDVEIVGCKFAPRKKCKVEPLLRGVSNVKQEVPVQVKTERGVTAFCSQGHDLVRIPVPPKQVESRRSKLYVSWQQVRCDKCGSDVADVSFRCDLCDYDMCETCAGK